MTTQQHGQKISGDDRGVAILPALLGADAAHLGEAARSAEAGGADAIHVDVLDGHFAGPISFGPALVRALRTVVRLPLDIHLQVAEPESHLELFIDAGADAITVHVEACRRLQSTIRRLRSAGVDVGLAVNPETPVATVMEVISDVDRVVVMTVVPGTSCFIRSCVEKIRALHDMIGGRGIALVADGGISVETVDDVVAAGARHIVAASYVFRHAGGPAVAIQQLRSAAALVIDRGGLVQGSSKDWK